MISRKKTRETLRAALKLFADKHNAKIDYPMVEFRHAVMDTADLCKGIVACNWTFDTEEKLTICSFFFKGKTAKCSYSYEKNLITVEQIETVLQDGEEMDILVRAFDCSCSELPNKVLEIQPVIKAKVVLKKRKEV